MSLPIVTLKNDEQWDCHQCGFCCRGSIVPLSKEDEERLRSQNWQDEPDYQKLRFMVPHRRAASSFRLAHRDDGTCVFLNEDGRCRIHAKFGLEAKPTTCRVFPMQLIPHEKHAVLTYRRACPSAAADRGTDAKQNLPLIKRLVKDGWLKAEPINPPALKSGESRDWKTIRAVLEIVGEVLRDERYPPVRRLVHALQFSHNMEAAKTRSLSNDKVVELAHTLAEWMPEESRPFFEERKSPTTISKVMFRLAALSCARLHPLYRQTATWSARAELVQTSWRCCRGTGQLPRFDNVFPAARFEELENPIGLKRPEIYIPLNRLIETSSESFLYAIANRAGWSVSDSIRGLALLFPIGMWMLRWSSCGREPTVDDMLNIVVALDRSQGYQPLSGPLQRWRLSMLSLNGELERLVVWYAR
ncbi:YkgJ family cysteine cluster protein [Neorhodopirellula pilleata]|uniref:Flagellin N-methylase n=1 Tax=Neorhodopirellula pilleata TaxID=2714738 RepID=A0A5C5ZWF8_9BACT|nr:YkgJ family cysteine cluster protein [Neorhodopirellula pilleata]TWT91347.1 Flagellin N-methylase [Neorhodopirellula pilleata]